MIPLLMFRFPIMLDLRWSKRLVARLAAVGAGVVVVGSSFCAAASAIGLCLAVFERRQPVWWPAFARPRPRN